MTNTKASPVFHINREDRAVSIEPLFHIRQVASLYEDGVLQESDHEFVQTMLSDPEEILKQKLKRSVDHLYEGDDGVERIDDFTVKEIISPTQYIINKWELVEHTVILGL